LVPVPGGFGAAVIDLCHRGRSEEPHNLTFGYPRAADCRHSERSEESQITLGFRHDGKRPEMFRLAQHDGAMNLIELCVGVEPRNFAGPSTLVNVHLNLRDVAV
jgi:hypothetical protein